MDMKTRWWTNKHEMDVKQNEIKPTELNQRPSEPTTINQTNEPTTRVQEIRLVQTKLNIQT